jgi:hypothetical protein
VVDNRTQQDAHTANSPAELTYTLNWPILWSLVHLLDETLLALRRLDKWLWWRTWPPSNNDNPVAAKAALITEMIKDHIKVSTLHVRDLLKTIPSHITRNAHPSTPTTYTQPHLRRHPPLTPWPRHY